MYGDFRRCLYFFEGRFIVSVVCILKENEWYFFIVLYVD